MSAASPLVSFIVPTYNYARYLGSCLDSILALDGGYSWEVLVIDDASSDDTSAVLARYSDARIRVVRHAENQGHALTVMEGLRAVTGEYVARIDPDDRYYPWFLTTTLPIFEQHPDVAMVYGDVDLIDEDGSVTSRNTDTVHGGQDFHGNEYAALLQKNFICAPSVIARRQVWLDALPVPEHLAFNDWWFTLMMARAHNVYFIARAIAQYRIHGSAHHVLISRGKREEGSVIWLLDRLYSERESNPVIEQQKQLVRRRAYAAHYSNFALKYFGHGYDSDARRALFLALRYDPRVLADGQVFRVLVAELIGRRWYERAKEVLRRVAGLGGRRETTTS